MTNPNPAFHVTNGDIRTNRMATTAVTVLKPDHMPLANHEVVIGQVRHKFLGLLHKLSDLPLLVELHYAKRTWVFHFLYPDRSFGRSV